MADLNWKLKISNSQLTIHGLIIKNVAMKWSVLTKGSKYIVCHDEHAPKLYDLSAAEVLS